jgi:hypothetical protein
VYRALFPVRNIASRWSRVVFGDIVASRTNRSVSIQKGPAVFPVHVSERKRARSITGFGT